LSVYLQVGLVDDDGVLFVGFSFFLANVDDGCGVVAEREVVVDVEVDRLVGGFSEGDDDAFDVLELHVHRDEAVVVFLVDVDDHLAAVAAGGQPYDLVQRDFPFDPVGHQRGGRGCVDEVLVCDYEGSLLTLINMVYLDHGARQEYEFWLGQGVHPASSFFMILLFSAILRVSKSTSDLLSI
jgi:hypothetical protein